MNECQCGCGALVARRYKPGHDARHKSALVASTRTAPNAYQREQAVDALIERGWESFADLDVLRTHPERNHRRQVRVALEQVERFLVGPDGDHHARHNCSRLTTSARKVGMVHSITRLATQAAITRIDPTPSLLHSLRTGFDACPECTIDWTLDEVTETRLSARASYIAAHEAITPVTGKARKVSAPSLPRPRTWTVEPDPIPVLWFPLPLLPLPFLPFLLIPPTTRTDLVLEAA